MNGFNITGVTETKITNYNPVDSRPTIPGYEFEVIHFNACGPLRCQSVD